MAWITVVPPPLTSGTRLLAAGQAAALCRHLPVQAASIRRQAGDRARGRDELIEARKVGLERLGPCSARTSPQAVGMRQAVFSARAAPLRLPGQWSAGWAR
jgi:hypothetical protein